MIAVLIFFIHLIFIVYVFCRSYQSDGVLQAFLNIVFIIILFTVGWTVSDLFTSIFLSANGYITTNSANYIIQFVLKVSGIYKPLGNNNILIQPKDAVSLILLMIGEILFYRYLLPKTKKNKS
jgi:hypothetical protein